MNEQDPQFKQADEGPLDETAIGDLIGCFFDDEHNPDMGPGYYECGLNVAALVLAALEGCAVIDGQIVKLQQPECRGTIGQHYTLWYDTDEGGEWLRDDEARVDWEPLYRVVEVEK